MKLEIVPRMLRNALRLQRGALLIRGPGLASWIPDLRSGMKNAASRPGHEAGAVAPVAAPS
ncbi:MAG: hypothetical protein JWR49_524 [Tardiphaga sp.]|nr:hypothetical protein [Tardiphaga sp.]